MTLLAHAPLQSSLNVTTYSLTPDSNGIHPVNGSSVITLSDGTTAEFIPTSSVGTNGSEQNLVVSGLSVNLNGTTTTFDGTYTFTDFCSLDSTSQFTMNVIKYDPLKPVYKNQSKYIAYSDNKWYAVSGSNFPTDVVTSSNASVLSNAVISIDGLSTVQSFNRPYPSKLGTFSHNFDQSRVSLLNCLRFPSGTSVTFTNTDSNPFSFWAFSDNKQAWSLFYFNGTLYADGNTSQGDISVTSTSILTSANAWISDIRFYDSLPTFEILNKHPMNPTFGFFQQSHSSNVGISGNQLNDTLSVFNKGTDTTSFQLANLQCNEIHSKTIDALKYDLNNIDTSDKLDKFNPTFSYEFTKDSIIYSDTNVDLAQTLDNKADKYSVDGSPVTLASLHNNKLNSNDPTFSGSLTGPTLKIGTTQNTIFTPGSLTAGDSTLSSLNVTGNLTYTDGGSTHTTTIQALANKLNNSHLSYNDGTGDKTLDGNIAQALHNNTSALTSKADVNNPSFTGSLTAGDSTITGNLTVSGNSTLNGNLMYTDDGSTITTNLQALANKADKYFISNEGTDVEVTIQSLDNALNNNSNALSSLASTFFTNSHPPLASHLPLQSNLSGHLYDGNTPFVATFNGTPSFVNVDDIDTGSLAPNLIVSNMGTYDGSYNSVSHFTILKIFNGDDKKISTTVGYQSYPVFQHTSDNTKYICLPRDKNSDITSWTFFTCDQTLAFSSGDVNCSSLVSLDSIHLSSTTFNDFTYPVLQDTFSHNFGFYRVMDINCLSMNQDDVLRIPKSSDILSFWAWTPNASSWSLYIIAQNRIYRDKDESTTNDDFSISTSTSSTNPMITISNTNSDILYISDIKQYTDDATYLDDDGSFKLDTFYDAINVHPLTPTFGFSHTGHSSTIGISANQLDDTLHITKNDDLGDLKVKNLYTDHTNAININTEILGVSNYITTQNLVSEGDCSFRRNVTVYNDLQVGTGYHISNITLSDSNSNPYNGVINIDNATVLRANNSDAHLSNHSSGNRHDYTGSIIGTNLTIVGGLSLRDSMRYGPNEIEDVAEAIFQLMTDVQELSGGTAGGGGGSGYALASHNHDNRYASNNHNHDDLYAPKNNNYAINTHNHDTTYAPIEHDHDLTYHNLNSRTVDVYYKSALTDQINTWANRFYKGISKTHLTIGEDFDEIIVDGNFNVEGDTYIYGSAFIWQNDAWSRITTYQAGGGAYSSDDRLKLNEKVISDASTLLSKLRPQVYDKLKKIDGNVDDATFEAGLIAQEIWYDCPELRHLVHVGEGGKPADDVATSSDPSIDPDYSSWGDSPASVNYTGFIPYLIRGFQEQHSVVESQKVEIFALKKENESMKSQIALLMKTVGLVDSGNVDV